MLALGAVVFCVIAWLLLSHSTRKPRSLSEEDIQQQFPLAWHHIQMSGKSGGGTICDVFTAWSDAAALVSCMLIPFVSVQLGICRRHGWATVRTLTISSMRSRLLPRPLRWRSIGGSHSRTFL